MAGIAQFTPDHPVFKPRPPADPETTRDGDPETLELLAAREAAIQLEKEDPYRGVQENPGFIWGVSTLAPDAPDHQPPPTLNTARRELLSGSNFRLRSEYGKGKSAFYHLQTMLAGESWSSLAYADRRPPMDFSANQLVTPLGNFPSGWREH
jgi:hypothetical protein